jgi:hypothetical protein
MNCHEKPKSRKPTVVKVGNAAIKIYSGKSRGYDLFTVVHYAGGQRKRETFAKLTDAKERAHEVARAMLNGRIAVLELTNADRDGYVKALELLQPLGVPLHSAVEEYVAARSHLHGESLLSAVKTHVGRQRNVFEKPAGKIVDELLAAKKRDGLSLRYIQSLRSHLTRFGKAFRRLHCHLLARQRRSGGVRCRHAFDKCRQDAAVGYSLDTVRWPAGFERAAYSCTAPARSDVRSAPE